MTNSEIVETLIGKTEEEAGNILTENGTPYRIVERDGENYIVTMDMHPDRANLSIEQGRITAVTFG